MVLWWMPRVASSSTRTEPLLETQAASRHTPRQRRRAPRGAGEPKSAPGPSRPGVGVELGVLILDVCAVIAHTAAGELVRELLLCV